MRSRAAARVAFSGSLRSSTMPLDFSPYWRPVRGMNCQTPCAERGERACGRKEDSMKAIQARSCGSPSSAKIRWIMGT